MNLNYKLKTQQAAALSLQPKETFYYSVPFDIGMNGEFIEDSYVIITNLRLIVLIQDTILKEYKINEITEIKNESQIGCGILMIRRHSEEYEFVVRYRLQHIKRYAFIVRGCTLLMEGNYNHVFGDAYLNTIDDTNDTKSDKKNLFSAVHKLKKGFLHDFFEMLAPYRKQLCVIILLMIAATVVTLLNPAVQKYIIDDVLKDNKGTYAQAFSAVFVLFLLSLGIIIINISKSYLCGKLGSTISMDLRKKLYYKIQVLSLSFINERRPGELMNRIINDTAKVSDFMGDTFCNMFTVAILFVCVIILMLILNPFLALVAFIFVPISIVVCLTFRKMIHRRFHRQKAMGDVIHSQLQDVLSGMSVVKSYGKEMDESEKFNHVSDEFARIQRTNETLWAVLFPCVQFLLGCGIYLVAYFSGNGVLKGTMSTGEVVQFITYTSLLYTYLNWLTYLPRSLGDMVNSIERISDVCHQEPAIVDHKDCRIQEIQGAIEFKNASFGYQTYQPVLEQINLKIKPGEMIGIVGASGTGKSTLINLIMHLYEVDDGQLLVDGVDIKDIQLDCYHRQIGVVLQETFLFAGTILSNIRFARPEATLEEVIQAAKMANAHSFILHCPNGYDTYVGEHGFSLSGGERQRIAIARAILSNPRILILDEATASLDTESEFLIQKALSRLITGRTTFAIAHRLSTLKDADRLIVIDGHNIAEVGTHNELMQKKGIYYGLVNAQLEMQET